MEHPKNTNALEMNDFPDRATLSNVRWIQSNILIIFCGVAADIFSFTVKSRANGCTCMEHWTFRVIRIRSLSLDVCVCVMCKKSERERYKGIIFADVFVIQSSTCTNTHIHIKYPSDEKMRASWTLNSNPIQNKNFICNASIRTFSEQNAKKIVWKLFNLS